MNEKAIRKSIKISILSGICLRYKSINDFEFKAMYDIVA